MEGHDDQAAQAPTPLLDRARKMAEIGHLARKMAERGRRRTTSGGGDNNRTAAVADVPIKINSKPAAGTGTNTKLVEVPEDLILQLMWEKACGARHIDDAPAAWKPRPGDPGDEQLSRVHEKARAIVRLTHRHVDDLILQYIRNGCAYEGEAQIGDEDDD